MLQILIQVLAAPAVLVVLADLAVLVVLAALTVLAPKDLAPKDL